MPDSQSAVIEFLSRPESYGGGVCEVAKIETHISIIFLVGERVYKLKRAVNYPYVDFSTVELRRRYCQAEVTINRRTAPDLYRGVVAVTAMASGGLRLGGDGRAVDWLVEMQRFDQDTLFDRLARNGGLNRRLMVELAANIAKFHLNAERKPETDFRRVLAATVASDAAAFAGFGGGVFDNDLVAALIEAENRAIDGRCGELAGRRRASGHIRHCHGDLHLRNIFLHRGRPTLFDAIEFNPLFAEIDVLYDLAFLLMDLDHRAMRRLANVVLNSYLDITGDTAGLACLPLYQCMRAAIRGHVGAAAALKDDTQGEPKRAEARAYLAQAMQYLNPPPPRLIAIGGLSGSGKSSLAMDLAPYVGAAPGARIARSDVLRKKLAGVDQFSRLGADGYSREMTAKTYRAVYDEARTAILSGHSAIADAVFADPAERLAIAAVADDLGISFQGIWLQASPRVMAERIAARRDDASDADADVLNRQLHYELGQIDWPRLDSRGDRRQTLAGGLAIAGL